MRLNELTITQAAKGLHKKEFSVAELVSDCLHAIEERNGTLHAYLDVFEDAEDRAKGADEILQNSHALPLLFGIPLAIKDNILIEGKRATAGSKILKNYVAPYHATAIQKLKNHGAIFLGKTNLDEFAMGSSTENSAFGPTKNPHNPERVPGGSSGGSAAAVAANLCLGALGSDTGGSIRQPASFCGIVGFKPSYGRVSRHGLIAMASSLDQIGPMAKTVADAQILFSAITGGDEFDATAIKDLGPAQNAVAHELRGVRIGVPKEYFGTGVEPEVEKSVRSAIEKCEAAGASIKEISLPHSAYALPAYYIIVPSEVSANLARYDGIRYGADTNQHADSLYDAYAKTRATGFGAEVKRRIMLGTYALSAGYYDAYYLKAQRVRNLIRKDFESAFEKVHVIVGPTTPTPAFRFGERANNPLAMYLADIYTVAVNLAGLPAISLPCGWAEKEQKKLPIGVQIIGKWFDEPALFSVAQAVEHILS